MKFNLSNKVSHPAAQVLDLMINRMDEIVPFLPNVESIELREREELPDGRIRIVRHWQGAASNVPAALRPFISTEMLGWIDTALWQPDAYKVDWEMSTSLSAFYECSGTNFFEPYPKQEERATRVRVTGELTIHPNKLPGIPSFLGSRLAPQVEKFVIALLTPNMEDLARGLQEYFDAREA